MRGQQKLWTLQPQNHNKNILNEKNKAYFLGAIRFFFTLCIAVWYIQLQPPVSTGNMSTQERYLHSKTFVMALKHIFIIKFNFTFSSLIFLRLNISQYLPDNISQTWSQKVSWDSVISVIFIPGLEVNSFYSCTLSLCWV